MLAMLEFWSPTKLLASKQSVCAVNGCCENHHRLFHRVQSVNIRNPDLPSAVETLPSLLVVPSNNSTELCGAETSQPITVGEQRNTTERSMTKVAHNESEAPGFAALRTVPVILKNGNR